MAKKRYYVVLVGRHPGIYNSSSKAQAEVENYKGFRMKGFKNLADAEKYFAKGNLKILKKELEEQRSEEDVQNFLYFSNKDKEITNPTAFFNNRKKEYMARPLFLGEEIELDEENQIFVNFNAIRPKLLKGQKVTAYVDGSYNPVTEEYGAGVVILQNNKIIRTFSRKGNNPELARYNNVAGEIYAAMIAIEYCVMSGVHNLDMFYDFDGIENILCKEAQGLLQNIYCNYCEKKMKHVKVDFYKVKSHSGNRCNDFADTLAREAVGLSKIKLPMCI